MHYTILQYTLLPSGGTVQTQGIDELLSGLHLRVSTYTGFILLLEAFLGLSTAT